MVRERCIAPSNWHWDVFYEQNEPSYDTRRWKSPCATSLIIKGCENLAFSPLPPPSAPLAPSFRTFPHHTVYMVTLCIYVNVYEYDPLFLPLLLFSSLARVAYFTVALFSTPTSSVKREYDECAPTTLLDNNRWR